MTFSDFQYLFCHWLSQRISKQSAYRVGHLAGKLSYYLKVQECRRVTLNAARAAGLNPQSPEAKSLAKRIYRSFSEACVELLYDSQSIAREDDVLRRQTALTGQKQLDEALAAGKGVIAMSAHVGYWELGAMALAAKGYPITIVAHQHMHHDVQDLFLARRKRWKVDTLGDYHSATQCLRHLKNNRVLGIMGDRLYFGKGVDANFFGHTAKLPRGPIALSVASGAPILTVAMLKKAPEGYALHVHDALYPPRPSASPQEKKEFMQKVLTSLERIISANVEQWYCFGKVWNDI